MDYLQRGEILLGSKRMTGKNAELFFKKKEKKKKIFLAEKEAEKRRKPEK